MPWYWTDDVARALVADSRLDAETARTMIELPVAFRSEHDTIDDAARELAEESEVPLAA